MNLSLKKTLTLVLLLLCCEVSQQVCAQTSAPQTYKVGVCDWMVLKRQKVGEFKLGQELGTDGIEMDMGGLGTRDTFDNKLHQPHFQKLFAETAAQYQQEVPSVAMSGFYGQSFLNHKNYKGLVADCLQTMKVMGAKIAFLPLGGIKEDWIKPGSAHDSLIYRLHEAGEMAAREQMVIGIRTPLNAKANKRLLREINSKGIKIYYSFQIAIEQRLNICKDLRRLGKKNICQIHCSNTDGALIEADSMLNMPKIKQTLDAMKWTGWLIVERSRDKNDVRNVKANYGANVRYLKDVFQK